ncbi:hypothetical protein [Streptomyces sp. LUP47B]|uniref:hypothetical protein n=1 Tax=Streptomyces sp. LUP47B TaxID=1890286 RepID=UPI000851DA16|nr:hypothetical protein [Streptomyces sp. LUP47B]
MNDTPTAPHQQTTIPSSLGHDFADTWCGTLTADIAPLLNCEEVNVLASLLRTLGAEQAADEWIDAHSVADNEPHDSHYQDPHDPAALSADAFRWHPGCEEA